MKTKSNYDYETLYEHHLYAVWSGQKVRCNEKKGATYKDYAGRGIKMSDEFRNDFYKWYDYVIGLPNSAKEGYSIDRIDNNKGYERGNIRWATHHMQAVNKRKYKCNTSGFTGVSKSPRSKKWKSSIRVNDKLYQFGSFSNKMDAVKARNNFIIKNGLTEYSIQ